MAGIYDTEPYKDVDYAVITAQTSEELREKVIEKLKDGFSLVGSANFYPSSGDLGYLIKWSQTVVKQ